MTETERGKERHRGQWRKRSLNGPVWPIETKLTRQTGNQSRGNPLKTGDNRKEEGGGGEGWRGVGRR